MRATSVSIANDVASDAGPHSRQPWHPDSWAAMGFTWENDLTCSTVVRRHRNSIGDATFHRAERISLDWLRFWQRILREAVNYIISERSLSYDRSSAITKETELPLTINNPR